MTNSYLPTDEFKVFFKEHLPNLKSTYNWPISAKAKSNLPCFSWQEEPDKLNECVALKQHLTRRWANGSALDRAELARWIVVDWGKVKRNKLSTLETHIRRVSDNDHMWPLSGIASYSKILSITNCTQYAIYDARVAACLNAVQLSINPNQPIFFQYVPSQKKIFKNSKDGKSFIQVFSKRELVDKRGWLEIKEDDTYTTYLKLLHSLKNHFVDTEIYHLEMILFGMAPSLCAQLLGK